MLISVTLCLLLIILDVLVCFKLHGFESLHEIFWFKSVHVLINGNIKDILLFMDVRLPIWLEARLLVLLTYIIIFKDLWHSMYSSVLTGIVTYLIQLRITRNSWPYFTIWYIIQNKSWKLIIIINNN